MTATIDRPRTAERRAQYLLVPLAGLQPVRRPRAVPRLVRLWRRRVQLATLLGVTLVIAAGVVTATTPPVAVYLSDDAVHADGLTLVHPAGNGGLATGRLYTGAATMLLTAGPGGTVVASAVTYRSGQKVRAVCTLYSPGGTEVWEACDIRTGRTTVVCHDVFDLAAGAWRRHCSDGQVLSIEVPAGTEVIPVPFPLGT
jgi:hypothetical protein